MVRSFKPARAADPATAIRNSPVRHDRRERHKADVSELTTQKYTPYSYGHEDHEPPPNPQPRPDLPHFRDAEGQKSLSQKVQIDEENPSGIRTRMRYALNPFLPSPSYSYISIIIGTDKINTTMFGPSTNSAIACTCAWHCSVLEAIRFGAVAADDLARQFLTFDSLSNAVITKLATTSGKERMCTPPWMWGASQDEISTITPMILGSNYSYLLNDLYPHYWPSRTSDNQTSNQLPPHTILSMVV
ncbi:hypothetical protein PV04_03344 [Phialophora macrospora]|uniref:Uncharacterized protein n=1 Tax=Phialophora macrospora TaxID=1851006 RepID=A0A0D2FS34_9EURO|nr:hypothetical protein PV04_03344 [Phialophora macrospora]